MSSDRARTKVYVDGLNLYYGVLRNTRFKWLDLQGFFKRIRPHDDILAIYYFTALVGGTARLRQRAYLDGLASCPLVKIIPGAFKKKVVKCVVEKCSYTGRRTFVRQEEKYTDVQIAIEMLHDAYNGCTDRFVLVTADSDLVPAVRAVKDLCPGSQVTVYLPGSHPRRLRAHELRSVSDKARALPLSCLRHSQLPPIVRLGDGREIHRPRQW